MTNSYAAARTNLVGKKKAILEEALEKVGCKYTFDDIFDGWICKFADGSDVACHFLTGYEYETYKMPQDEGDVSNVTVEELIDRLVENGLTNSDKKADVVIGLSKKEYTDLMDTFEDMVKCEERIREILSKAANT